MRILIFTSLFPNKAEPQLGIFIFQRILHLSRRPNNHVQVIAPLPYFPRWFKWSKRHAQAQVLGQEQNQDLTVYHPRYFLLPGISMPFQGLLMFVGSLFKAIRLHKKEKFDCIDAHFIYPDGTAAVMLGKVLGLPVIVSARGTDINFYPKLRLIRTLIQWTLKKASGLIAVSASLKNVMVEMGVPPSKVRVIGNGIDPSLFKPVDSKEARNQLNMPDSARVVVSVGSLIPRKGFQYLIPAFAVVAQKFPGAHLYLIGEGSFRAELEELAKSLKIRDRVSLVGNQPNEQLYLWFGAADVSCLVSSREGWPNVLQESLACGTPVIATNLWGAPEVITSSELGLLVDQNSQAIASALETALTKRWDRRAIAAHAHKRTWDIVAGEVEDYLAQTVTNVNKAHRRNTV
jgi:teichuronic acid biosynthesis glycosyltransferase TuaC